jgi:IS5 family transposase
LPATLLQRQLYLTNNLLPKSATIKRTLGDAVRARTWYGEFRELVLMCTVHNIKQSLKP